MTEWRQIRGAKKTKVESRQRQRGGARKEQQEEEEEGKVGCGGGTSPSVMGGLFGGRRGTLTRSIYRTIGM